LAFIFPGLELRGWIYQILTSPGYMIYIPGLTSKSKKHPTLVHNQSSEKEPKELVVLYNHGSRFYFLKILITTFITSGPFSGSFMKTLGSHWNWWSFNSEIFLKIGTCGY
jgi:hypothetical protein